MDAANVDLKAFTRGLLPPGVRGAPRRRARHAAVPHATRPTSGSRSRRCSSPAATTPTRRSTRRRGGSPTSSARTCRCTSRRSTPTTRCSSVPRTPATTLRRARAGSRLGNGLRYVYDGQRRTTPRAARRTAPGAVRLLVVRDWYDLRDYRWTPWATACAAARACPGCTPERPAPGGGEASPSCSGATDERAPAVRRGDGSTPTTCRSSPLLGDGLLGTATTAEGPPAALIVPHAAYTCSGAVAAPDTASSWGSADRTWSWWVRRTSPTCREWSYPRPSCGRRRLGGVPVDQERCGVLVDLGLAKRSDYPHRGEHAVEVQLPFLQRVLASPWTLRAARRQARERGARG